VDAKTGLPILNSLTIDGLIQSYHLLFKDIKTAAAKAKAEGRFVFLIKLYYEFKLPNYLFYTMLRRFLSL
jgi:hypothetical protein